MRVYILLLRLYREQGTEHSIEVASDLIRDFVALQILREMTGYKRNRLFAFTEYLTILKK